MMAKAYKSDIPMLKLRLEDVIEQLKVPQAIVEEETDYCPILGNTHLIAVKGREYFIPRYRCRLGRYSVIYDKQGRVLG